MADVFLESSFVQVTSIRVEISNHPSKMSSLKNVENTREQLSISITLLLSMLKNLVMSELCSSAWFVKCWARYY